VRRALEYIPNAAEFHLTHSLILEGLGDFQKARQAAQFARTAPVFKQLAEQLLSRLPVPESTNGASMATAETLKNTFKNREESFLLCRPHGGLNDTFCQIEKCWRYAEKFGRTLIIDTRKSCLFGEFSDFFTPANTRIKVETNTTKIDAAINSLHCYPPLINGPQINQLLDWDVVGRKAKAAIRVIYGNNTKAE
jgi:hypothetical protein